MKAGDDECGLSGPDDRYLLFLKVPEAKSVKNRMHLCVRPVDRSRDAEVERILGLGPRWSTTGARASRAGPCADPEGNEFCVLTRYQPGADPDDGSGD